MTNYIQAGNKVFVSDEDNMKVHKRLPPTNYIVNFNEMSGDYFLTAIDSFVQVPKLYGTTAGRADRILNTFFSRPSGTGVVLTGEKGSGKTLLGKTLSIEAGVRGFPTILVNQPWHGDAFNKFIQDIDQPALIMFDEFEKVYNAENQEAMLTLLDGVFPSQKLFIITCNDPYRINFHMKNRPGRIFYMIDFRGLESEFIEEYCEDNLNNKGYIQKIITLSHMFQEFNFDMLKALVEEMNRYNEPPEQAILLLNAKPEYSEVTEFDVMFFKKGKQLNGIMNQYYPTTIKINPLKDSFVVYDYTAKKNEDTDGREWKFNARDLQEVSSKDGTFTYYKEGTKTVQIVLRKTIKPVYDYLGDM